MKKEKPTPHDDSDIPELIYGEEEEEPPIFPMIGIIVLILVSTIMFLSQ